MQVRTFLLAALACVASGCTFNENRSILVKPEQLACKTVDDCAWVHLSCASCGSYVARSEVALLSSQQQKLCEGYRGPIPDCPVGQTPVCREGVCATAFPGESQD